MERLFWMFVPSTDIDEDKLQHNEVIDWSLNNLSHPNVVTLSEDDVYFLDYETKALDIINKENNSMLQWGEDDWIIEMEVKLKIQHQLNNYLQKLPIGRAKELVQKIISLVNISIKSERNLYFNF